MQSATSLPRVALVVIAWPLVTSPFLVRPQLLTRP
jgi:hypothetical protein